MQGSMHALCVVPERQRYHDTVRYAVLGVEVQGHHEEQYGKPTEK